MLFTEAINLCHFLYECKLEISGCDPCTFVFAISIDILLLTVPPPNEKNTKASLRAETMDHTEFIIRLYKCKNNNMLNIMVEVQRSTGESFNYMRYAKLILAFAKGEGDIDHSDYRKKCSSSGSLSCIPGSILSSRLHENASNCGNDETAIDLVKELLKKDRLDARQLGLNSLLLLTDSRRSLVSESAAKAVLQEDENCDSIIRDFVFNSISSPRNRSTTQEKVDWFESRDRDIIHNMALAVLANSLESALESRNSDIDQLLQSQEWTGTAGYINLLLNELSNARHRLHDAYQACRCICTLLESSSDINKVLHDRNAGDVLKNALLVGAMKHSMLAAECNEALTLISDHENIPPSFYSACDIANSLLHWPCY